MQAETHVKIDVLILAAGLGTRMHSRRAKVLHRAGGRSLIEHVVEAARAITSPARITVASRDLHLEREPPRSCTDPSEPFSDRVVTIR